MNEFLSKFKTRNLISVMFACLFLVLVSCSDDDSPNSGNSGIATKIMVFSDPHLMDPSLYADGKAFQAYLAQDRKMLAQSDAIMQEMTRIAVNDKSIKIVLVCGDLTKDGEALSHSRFAGYLKQIENSGKKVFVIPGNHDINNSNSMKFVGDNEESTPTITPDQFKSIYNEFGFSQAIAKDPNSLSYIVEPVNGLWLFCLDPVRYKENTNATGPITGGKFSDETLTWIKGKLQEAKTSGKLVFGMEHHGLIEHFTGQKTASISSDYVIDNWENVSQSFADLGMKIMFTGHFHANDITKRTLSSSFIFDIETGSLVTCPSPYRIITLSNDKKLTITTSHIENINYDLGGKTFQKFSDDFITEGMTNLITYQLTQQFKISAQVAAMVVPTIVDAFKAHYAGDEQISANDQAVINLAKNYDGMSAYAALLQSLFTDLPPADNNITIDLNTGNF